MFDKFLKFKVRPLLCLVVFPFEQLEPLLSYSLYQCFAKLVQVFGVETIVITTFCHAVNSAMQLSSSKRVELLLLLK